MELIIYFASCIFCVVQNSLVVNVFHQSASSIVQYARIARKHRWYPVCLESLSKIHSMSSVPVMDCFLKIKEQVSKFGKGSSHDHLRVHVYPYSSM